MEFALIPSGAFSMGTHLSQNELSRRYGGRSTVYKYEKPYHHVEIKMPFYMQTTRVTHRQWNYIMGTEIADYNWKDYIGTKNSDYNNKGDDYPLFHISWYEVQEFIERLNRMEHTDRYRLPSEAEWEYACRAESDTAFCFGDNVKGLGKFAWYCDNSSKNLIQYAKRNRINSGYTICMVIFVNGLKTIGMIIT